MKKFPAIAFAVCAVAGQAVAQNVSIANTRKTEIAPTGHFTLSLEYERLFQRDLDDAGVSGIEFDDLGVISGALDPVTRAVDVELESNMVFVRTAYSIYAPEDEHFGIEVYFLIGGADTQLDGGVGDPGPPFESFNVDGDFGLLFGGGVRARVYSQGPVKVFVDGSVRYTENDSSIGMVPNLDLDLGLGETAVQDFTTKVLSWQISGYVAYEFEVGDIVVAPYGGIRLSGVDVDVDGEQLFFDPGFDGRQTINYSADQSDILGLIVGAEAGFTSNFAAFLEFSLIDQFAVAVGGSFTF